MQLAKPILVAALALAAAVLFPMRKAQCALARTQATAANVSSPRPPGRRRPSGPQQLIKREPIDQQTGNNPVALREAGPSAHGVDGAQPAPQTHAPAAAADCDSIVESFDYALRPQPT